MDLQLPETCMKYDNTVMNLERNRLNLAAIKEENESLQKRLALLEENNRVMKEGFKTRQGQDKNSDKRLHEADQIAEDLRALNKELMTRMNGFKKDLIVKVKRGKGPRTARGKC